MFHFVEFSQHNLDVGEDEHVANDQELDIVPDGLRRKVAVAEKAKERVMTSLVLRYSNNCLRVSEAFFPFDPNIMIIMLGNFNDFR